MSLPPPSAPPPPPPPPPSSWPGATTPTGCWPTLPGARLQPLGGLVTAVTILLAATIAACLAETVVLFYRSNLLDRVLDGSVVSFEEVDRADNLVQGTLILSVLGFLTSGIVFIVWQYRLANNAERFTGPLGLTPGWAIGGWFIPLAAPVLAAVQIDQADDRSGGRRPHGARVRRIVIAWLVAWYLGVVVFGVANAVRPDYDDNDFGDLDAARDFVQADRIAAAGFVLIVAAGVLAVLIVRKVSARQSESVGGA